MRKQDLELIQNARERFDFISEKARREIFQKVLKHFQKHPGSPWSGKPLVELEQSIKAFYAEMGWEYTEVFRETLPETMQRYYDTAVSEMRKAGLQRAIVGKPDPKRVKYFMDSTFEQVAMKTNNMSFQHIKQLRAIAADVTRQMSITGATRKEVSKAMLNKALEIPGFQFIDKGGTKWQAKSYFDMLARTELMNAARASYDDKCAEEGFDVVELTYSGHSCSSCDRWEGRLFSLTGATKGLPTKDDLIADGVFHPNCTHSYTLVPQSVFEEDFNPDGTPKTAEQNLSEKLNNAKSDKQYGSMYDDKKFPKVTKGIFESFQSEWKELIEKTATLDEVDGVEWMTSNAGYAVNKKMRGIIDEDVLLWDQEKLLNISQKTSSLFDKIKTPENITVYRCVSNADFLPSNREIFVEKGFSSCSIKPRLTFGNVIMEIKVPKGSRGAYVSSISTNDYEHEFLLDKNTKYVILKRNTITIEGEKFKRILVGVVND